MDKDKTDMSISRSEVKNTKRTLTKDTSVDTYEQSFHD
jgi:hypothetical protein